MHELLCLCQLLLCLFRRNVGRADSRKFDGIAVKKGNKELLDFINNDIKKLGQEQFFHKDYQATLASVYGSAVNPDDLVVEGGVVKK